MAQYPIFGFEDKDGSLTVLKNSDNTYRFEVEDCYGNSTNIDVRTETVVALVNRLVSNLAK